MSSFRVIHLKGGLTVPPTVLQLLWNLEDRGVRLTLESYGIMAEPGSKLTDEDRAAIRRWRRDLGALVAYEAPAEELPQ